MLLAYFDDSGEEGIFLLAGVVVQESEWLQMLDAWTDYRRWLRQSYGLRISKGSGRRVPVELHATDIATGQKDWRPLKIGLEGRLRAYRVGLRLIGRFARVFAVAWVPERAASPYPSATSPLTECWTVALERLTTYSMKSASGARALTFVDAGYEDQLRKVLRRMRRYHRVGSIYGGSLPAAAPMLLDDPVLRESKQSPFIQMADLCAYAALRELRPTKRVGDLWPHLGEGVLRQVNQQTRGQPPGIKLLPP